MYRLILNPICLAILAASPLAAQSPFFASRTDYPGLFSGPPATGDFDGDGRQDIAVAGFQNVPSFSFGIYVFLADPAMPGKFRPPIFVPTVNAKMIRLVAGDFDRDGKTDLISVSGLMWFLHGNGDGTFQTEKFLFPGTNASLMLMAADLNGDGNLDLLFASGMRVYMGKGDGTFFPAVNYLTNCSVSRFALANFNRDTRPDIVAECRSATHGLAFLTGNGDGTFAAPTYFGQALDYRIVTAGDFNADGHQDLIVARTGTTEFFKGDGRGGFQVVDQFAELQDMAYGVADLNFDGRPDLVTLAGILPGLGNGTFGTLVPLVNLASDYAYVIPILDLNGDGAPDVIVSGPSGGGQISVFLTAAPYLFLSVSQNPVTTGQSVTLSAAVAASKTGTFYVTAGKVQFYSGITAVGQPANLVNGAAVLNTNSLPQGIHYLRAIYLNNLGIQIAVSTPVTFNVNPTTCAGSLSERMEPATGPDRVLLATCLPTDMALTGGLF